MGWARWWQLGTTQGIVRSRERKGGEGGTTLGARQCANRFATGQRSTRAGQQPQQQGFLSRSCAGEGAMADPNSAAMAVQAQIRENNFEMQDFLRDLRVLGVSADELQREPF